MLVIFVRNKMWKRILDIFERDSDITYGDEFHYIYITIRELVEVIKTKNT
jgi:hypothetical protein